MSAGPFTDFAHAAQDMRRPFMPEATKWKVQTSLGGKGKDAKGGLIVAYIDARLVIERLNLLTPNWRDLYIPASERVMRCDLSIQADVPGGFITRSGFGEGGDFKARESDSLKRAGVKFGIGVSLYSLAQVTLWRVKAADDTRGNALRPNWKGELELDDANRAWLRDTYARWLGTDRGKHFGEPLDHGDSFGAVGDPEDPDAEAPEPPADPAVTAELERLREEVEVAYLQLRAAAPKAMTPGAYKTRYEGADAEGLAKLLQDIGDLMPVAA